MGKIFAAAFLALFVGFTAARNKSPLLDEDGTRVKNKAAECIFGKEVLELGAQWIPDLGVPIGVLYCMKCECVPFHRKRRIIARVQCRSIKNECPEPTCEEPVLLPGRCCKSCPGDAQNTDIVQDIVPQNAIEEEEKNSKHYAALLTGRSSLLIHTEDMKPLSNDINKNNVVATGRFTFHRRSLYYSFYISDKAARPYSLQFVNGEGTILEEFILSSPGGHVNSVYQNATRKICGSWKRLPRDYRKMLKEERMYAVLVWGVKDQAEFMLSGQILKYVALGTELFSSLLEPAPGTNATLMTGAGGTAIVSTSTTVSPSIHLAVVFNGIFTPDEISEVPVEITLSMDERKQIILQEKMRVTKPARELNLLEISSPISPADLRLLTKARLLLTISSTSKSDSLKLSGNVITKASCELFQTALSSSASDKSINQQGVSGLSWLYLNNEGSLVYNVQVDGLNEERKAVSITLVDVGAKRRTELEDLTPSFYHGWANGTVKLGPKVLDSLYSGNLAVNVATETESSLIRGKLSPKLVADARDSPSPLLLKREDYNLPTSAVGLAWILIDNDCHLHYDVYVSGLGSNNRQLQLYMELLPMIAPGAPVITRFLDEFLTNQVEGSPTEPLPREELIRLDTGVVFIKVKDKATRETLLAATLKQIKVPQTCLPNHVTDNDVPISYDTEVSQNGACLHEGKFYQEEAQWTSTVDPCTMCFCQNGNFKCDTMTCPDTNCGNTKKVKIPGECCSICTNNTALQEINTNIPRGCTFGGRFYSAGSKIHPFLIPEGFDRCTECVCDPYQLEMKCTRLGHCSSHTDIHARISENFTYVNDPVPEVPNKITISPTVNVRSAENILAAGGCKNVNNPDNPYENGAEFHPFIASLGEYKCITCKCRNSRQEDCTRVRCNLEVCDRIYDLRTMAQKNTTDFCCSKKQCKKFRVKKKSQRVHLNHSG